MPAFKIDCARPWLVARFAEPQAMLSWSLTRPGFVVADRVAWREVRGEELTHVEDPAAWLRSAMTREGLADAVGLMTARNVASHLHAASVVEDVRADCLITLGLNNGERVGVRAAPAPQGVHAGTINLLCAVSVPLAPAALLEALSLATQARTVALMETAYRRDGASAIVTGTGTDCIVLSAPAHGEGSPFAGMHTAIGEAIGTCVLQAAGLAAQEWRTGLARTPRG